MKQIVDKLNKIAKKIDESVEIPQTDLIIDSLDAITKAYGGTPNDSNLIVDKLEDIYNNIGSVPTGNIEITENGENINVAPFATATVNVSGGGGESEVKTLTLSVYNRGTSVADVEAFYIDDEGILKESFNVGPENIASKEVLIRYYTEDEEYFVTVEMGFVTYVSYSDAVNCTVFDEDGVYIAITDINEPASVTVTVEKNIT